MKSILSKIMVVLLATVSLAYTGFAILTFSATPNWEQYIGDLKGFRASKSVDGGWSLVRARGEDPVKSDKLLPKVLIAGYDEIAKAADAETAELDGKKEGLLSKLSEMDVQQKADIAALENKVAEQRTVLAESHKQWAELGKQVIGQNEESQKIEAQVASRREDVYRLEAQIAEIRGDKFRLEQIRQQLRDLISQYDASLVRAEERQAELGGVGERLPYVDKPAAPDVEVPLEAN